MVTLKQIEPSATQTTLFATDRSNSVLAEINTTGINQACYTAYGQQSSEKEPSSTLAFNGEPREPITSWYMLGNGNRVYNPVLMRFHSPDKFSPFNAGGLNAYMYCVGDPINRSDPTGNFPIWARFTAGLAAVGVVTGVASASTNGETRTILGAIALTAIVGASVVGGFKLSRAATAKKFWTSAVHGKKPGYTALHSSPIRPQVPLKASTASSIEPVTALPLIGSDRRAVTTLNNTLKTAAPDRPNYWPDRVLIENQRRENMRIMQRNNEIAELQAMLDAVNDLDALQIARARRTPQRAEELRAQGRVLRRT